MNPFDAYRLARYRQQQRETNRLRQLYAALRGSNLPFRLLVACIVIFAVWMVILLVASSPS